jgi:hypothetical protein
MDQSPLMTFVVDARPRPKLVGQRIVQRDAMFPWRAGGLVQLSSKIHAVISTTLSPKHPCAEVMGVAGNLATQRACHATFRQLRKRVAVFIRQKALHQLLRKPYPIAAINAAEVILWMVNVHTLLASLVLGRQVRAVILPLAIMWRGGVLGLESEQLDAAS